MDDSQQESYTVDIEQLLEMFCDGMMSGITTTLVNTKYGPDGVELAREESLHHLYTLMEDPAATETIRDTIRARMNGSPHMRTMLKINTIQEDNNDN